MPRKLILFAAIAVLGSMLALWLLTRGDKSSANTPTVAEVPKEVRLDRPMAEGGKPVLTDDTPQTPVTPETRADVSGAGQPKNADPNRPLAAKVEGSERGTTAPPSDTVLEYTLPDGRKVRDHRPPDQRKPMDLPPSTQPPGGRRIKPELTGLYSEAIQKHMRECSAAVPKDLLTNKPRLEGQILIAIKAEQGSVASAVFKLTNVANDAIANTAQQCMQQKALSVKVPAPGEADLDSYSINLSFAFL